MIVRAVTKEASSGAGFILFMLMSLAGHELTPADSPALLNVLLLGLLFAVMLWCAFNVVRHAESLAALLGEPYGTLILTLAVIGIEVALIVALMLTGADSPTLARDTMFSVIMIVLNGLVGISLVIGGLRYRNQVYNLQGASAFMSVLLALSVLCLVLPSFTPSAPGGQLSKLQATFLAVASIALYAVFLAIQTRTHSDIFQHPGETGGDDEHHKAQRSVVYHACFLVLAMLPIVLLSKKLALYIDHGIAVANAPVALGGFLIAAIILTPEGLSAVHAARNNKLQRAVNITLGSALATIGLTIPVVLGVAWMIDATVELGLEVVDIVLLVLTLMVSMVTFMSRKTNVLQGGVHLTLFAAYVVLIFDTHSLTGY